MALISPGNGTNLSTQPGNALILGAESCTCTPPTDDLRNYLLTLQNQRVRITTSTEDFSGILLAVKLDYIVLSENQGSLVLIPISKIRTVTEI
ncbi:DUF2642 domain-containing protein (plasmid) [Priestia aryabhattai]|uniref:DUF2642 domain-containing protein n=1 Tax=Priestia aryabhattai TaxID=412384 RepID=UPI0035AC1982